MLIVFSITNILIEICNGFGRIGSFFMRFEAFFFFIGSLAILCWRFCFLSFMFFIWREFWNALLMGMGFYFAVGFCEFRNIGGSWVIFFLCNLAYFWCLVGSKANFILDILVLVSACPFFPLLFMLMSYNWFNFVVNNSFYGVFHRRKYIFLF